jgi:DNA-binding transcriptional ArsR family regulator
MDILTATSALSALGQQSRLEAFRLLIQAGHAGMPAGDIGKTLDIKQNTLSANLAVLRNAGLVRNEREGRSIRYFADIEGLNGLLSFILEDCCGGKSDLCKPLINDIVCACRSGGADHSGMDQC